MSAGPTSPAALRSTTGATPLVSIVGYLLRRGQQVLTTGWTTVLEGELTGPQYAVLTALSMRPGLDQQTLGTMASLDASSITDVVRRLIAREWVDRERDPSDRRRYVLRLSAACQAQLHELTAGAHAAQELLLAPLSTHDRETLVRGLRRIAKMPPAVDTVPAPVLSFHDSAAHLLRRAQQVHTAIWAGEFGGELTGPQYATMRVLVREGSANQKLLGDRAALDRSNVADIVSRLAARGWVRSTPDPEDRRWRIVRLTRDGSEVMARVAPGVERVQSRVIAPVRATSRAPFLNALTRVAFRGEPPSIPW